ncbi:abasic site processing protein HMCES isoform X2 [Cherax quadricarinatus]|uniref:abasic site processing protein HMCES isoform X2 n=1 Tax=Cherax quadricarinatus TaxID=27406 RepID=UPI0023790A99|nr:abasic site processing protein HMCES-like isoform X2 [Cherax quadricarinatus]
MCGRTACTLAPDEICKACSVLTVTEDGKKCYKPLQWKEHPGNYSYAPSYNMAPSRITPVIISEHHVQGTKRDSDDETVPPQRIIQPMMWGLIPPFYKGSAPTGHGLKTSNCRFENIEEKKTFKPSLVKGQRCVVLCDGFYEWQTSKGGKNKQPYFVYTPQPKGIEIWNRESWDKPNVWNEEEGWKGPQLLKMAGLFSYWVSTESWLDFGHIGYKEALTVLKNEMEITWHPVSTAVNNSRNQEPQLNAPISLEKKPPQTASSKLMATWLSKGSVKKGDSTPIKKESLEPKEEPTEELEEEPKEELKKELKEELKKELKEEP